MTLQSSGQISLADIATEFGDTAPHSMSEFYGAASGIPTSGAISIGDFYGASSGPPLYVYDNVSFFVGSQETNAFSLDFSTDGTKMYMMSSTDYVHQYTLSTAFDLSTASFDNVDFRLISQTSDADGIAISSDGTKLYVVDAFKNDVFQSTMSTPFDLSTASADSFFGLHVNPQDGGARTIKFNPDGTKMFMLGSSSDSVYQYTLTTGFDISTASYDNVSFSISNETLFPQGFVFNDNGTKMYILDSENRRVLQYTTSNAPA